jgi:hypothetical protein
MHDRLLGEQLGEIQQFGSEAVNFLVGIGKHGSINSFWIKCGEKVALLISVTYGKICACSIHE